MDKTPQEPQDVTEKLKTLRGLAENDESDASLLKCRIEQQAELIYILKKRADEYLKKYMDIDNEKATFQRGMADVAAKYEDVKKANDLLRDRFDTLQKNHAELIEIKDEYKIANQKLRLDNERLKSANENLFSEVTEEKNETILQLNTDLQGLTSKLQNAEQREKDLEDKLQTIKQEMEHDLVDLKYALEIEKSAHQEKMEEIEKTLNLAQTQQKLLTTALEESNKKAKMYEETNAILKKGHSDFHMQTEDLIKQLDVEKDKVKLLEQKLKKEFEFGPVNSSVRRLTSEIAEEKRLRMKLIKEFDAFKKHSGNLLNKERELNANLRTLHLP